ncbi:MAG: radical SAM protein [Candidatus Omnitrophica bacterium]|nr:radical SAM protein [Candidatus Omnitrophota bacterium]
MPNADLSLTIKRFKHALILFLKYSTLKKFLNLVRSECQRRAKAVALTCRAYCIKIEPTNICDSGCEYCPHAASPEPRGKMRLADFKAIIDKNKDFAYLAIMQYSGEPLLNEDIYEMIGYAHSAKVATYMSTNLQHLKASDAVKLVSSGLDLLTVSIDGVSDDTYNRYRKSGKLSVVLDNIRSLAQAKKALRSAWPIINLQYLVMGHNEHQAGEAGKLARTLGVDSFELKPVGVTCDMLRLLPKDPRYVRRVYKKNAGPRQPCWWLWSAIVVLWDGRVIPCCSPFYKPFDKSVSGNMIRQTPDEIRNSQAFRQLRQTYPSKNCSDCLIPYGSVLNQTL